MESIRLHPAVPQFLEDHLRWCCEEDFLIGLGAVGPGHEWAIPAMFQHIIGGLRAAGFAEHEIGYFTLHVEQDQDHGAWLEEALLRLAVDGRSQALIREGCLRSLAARERLWWGIADKINAGRMAARFPHLPSATNDAGECTLAELHNRLRVRAQVG
jgi:hypothetical protein